MSRASPLATPLLREVSPSPESEPDRSRFGSSCHPSGRPQRPAATAQIPVAEVRGVNLHARQRVDGRDRRQLERLCRYITRTPVAQDRLEERPDGKLELALKSIWKDGTRAIIRYVSPCPVLT